MDRDEDTTVANLTTASSLQAYTLRHSQSDNTKPVGVIHRLESTTASVKFTGNIITGLSDSENDFTSSEEEVDYTIKEIDLDKKVTVKESDCDDFLVCGKPETAKNQDRFINDLSTSNRESIAEVVPPAQGRNESMDDINKRKGQKFQGSRFNPFDRDLHMDEDHFQHDQDNEEYESYRPKSSSNGSSWTNISNGSEDITNADLGLAEDHFSHPEGHFGLSSTEELEMAIENCKEMISDAPAHSDRQKNLVQKLVQLRMKLQEIKDGPEMVPDGVKVVVGHRFTYQESRSTKYYCEKCNAMILGVIQTWFECNECGYRCHEKCLNNITRMCASQKVLENPTYCLDICPNRGLAAQNYRCAECRETISFKSGFSEPRLCDYSGFYFCERCHWNDTMVSPARVLHNWDFEAKKVCRASKQFLKLMTNKAVIRIQDINPMLFNFVEELNEVKKLREELLIMKKYLLLCNEAMKKKFLLMLQSRQHFVENSDVYSMQDLLDIVDDKMLGELAPIHSAWAQHIKTDCELCQAKGFICELCDEKEILFPFDSFAIVCSQCSYVLHRHCFAKRGAQCPRCDRRSRRRVT